jgi:hypothetical protein
MDQTRSSETPGRKQEEALQYVGTGNTFLNRTQIAQEIEQELTNGATSN